MSFNGNLPLPPLHWCQISILHSLSPAHTRLTRSVTIAATLSTLTSPSPTPANPDFTRGALCTGNHSAAVNVARLNPSVYPRPSLRLKQDVAPPFIALLKVRKQSYAPTTTKFFSWKSKCWIKIFHRHWSPIVRRHPASRNCTCGQATAGARSRIAVCREEVRSSGAGKRCFNHLTHALRREYIQPRSRFQLSNRYACLGKNWRFNNQSITQPHLDRRGENQLALL